MRRGAILALLLSACSRPDRPGRAGTAADGGHHYTIYSAEGEVTDDRGNVDIYRWTHASMLAPAAVEARPLVYVPNSRSASVSVIDPRKYTVVRTFKTGAVPQHIVPSYDLRRLWILNNQASTLTPIDPVTGEEGTPVPVDDPYNMYFTPDGRFALVIAEHRLRIDFRDAQTLKLVESVHTPCRGIDHMDFTPDGRFVIATCEFNGHLLKIDLASRKPVGYMALDPARGDTASMPQDVRSSPDGRVFYVADMKQDGVHLIDPESFLRIGFVHTGKGAHGLYPSRDGRLLY